MCDLNGDAERRKRWSDTYKGVADSEDDDLDGLTEKEIQDIKLKKEEEELSKMGSGIGKVFLKNVKEREKFKQWKAANLDPRNASRWRWVSSGFFFTLQLWLVPGRLLPIKNRRIGYATIIQLEPVRHATWTIPNPSTMTSTIGLSVVGRRR